MSDIFSKNLKKQSARAKEKLLVSLGKADQTVDEAYEEASTNFARQQKAAERLHKELRNYVACVKAIGLASHGLQEALRDTYEPEWPGGDHVRAMSQSLELLWDDYHDKLQDQALKPIAAHAQQFADLRAKMAKRGRKLTDFDHARHTADAAKASAKGSAGDAKTLKATDQVALARKHYEDLNLELLDELPALYDSRITFYVAEMQAVFNLQQTFHSETAKLARELCVQMDDLGHALGRLRGSRHRTDSLPPAPKPHDSQHSNNNHPAKPANAPPPAPAAAAGYPRLSGLSTENGACEKKAKEEVSEDEDEKNPFAGGTDSEASSRRNSGDPGAGAQPQVEQPADVVHQEPPAPPPAAPAPEAPPKTEEPKEEAVDEAKAPAVDPPKTGTEALASAEAEGAAEGPGASERPVLYKVRATHRYAAEDGDELSFEAGELIEVLPFDDPEDQDEGWLFGRKVNTAPTGVFPANFTKPA